MATLTIISFTSNLLQITYNYSVWAMRLLSTLTWLVIFGLACLAGLWINHLTDPELDNAQFEFTLEELEELDIPEPEFKKPVIVADMYQYDEPIGPQEIPVDVTFTRGNLKDMYGTLKEYNKTYCTKFRRWSDAVDHANNQLFADDDD